MFEHDGASSSTPGGPVPVRLRLRLSPSLRELLTRVIDRVHAAMAAAPGNSVTPKVAGESDAELDHAWEQGLRESEAGDAAALLHLLQAEGFGLGDLALDAGQAEAVMRSSVHVRLHLRDTLLRDLNTAELEGELDFFRLPLAEQQGFACYRLLLAIEQDLLLQLDPGLGV
jgi:hypothetical protein